MNGKEKVRRFGKCPDCGRILLPKPKRIQDGCIVRPLFCQKCREEKFLTDIKIFIPKADDLPGTAAQS